MQCSAGQKICCRQGQHETLAMVDWLSENVSISSILSGVRFKKILIIKTETTETLTAAPACSALVRARLSAPRLTHILSGSAWSVCLRRRSRPPDSRSRRQPSGQSPPFISPQSSREPLSLRPCFSGRPPRLKNAGITCAESWHGGRGWRSRAGEAGREVQMLQVIANPSRRRAGNSGSRTNPGKHAVLVLEKNGIKVLFQRPIAH